MLRLFDKLLSLADEQKSAAARSELVALCAQLGGLRDVPRVRLQAWIRCLVVGSSCDSSNNSALFNSPAQERQIAETRHGIQREREKKKKESKQERKKKYLFISFRPNMILGRQQAHYD